MRETVVGAFRDRFGEEPAFVVRAPGRVNLIGEHTDYNDGFVLPMAIDRAVWIALRPRADGRVRLESLDYGDALDFHASGPEHGGVPWGEYPKGVAWALSEAGYALTGWEGTLGSDVPIGAGLSSSAALELATARAFAAVSGFTWDPAGMARMAQRAENEWVGVGCGIMDQMISSVGKEGHAVLIDCRTLRTQSVPMPDDAVVAILDTTTRRGLVDSAYNARRAQCEAVVAHFGVPALRDLSPNTIEERKAELEPVAARRARHVVTENARTTAAAEAMLAGDAVRLGRLMDESHESLRDDFEVSSPALDGIVRIARGRPGCLGARMTGAGFGGCAVALVERPAADDFCSDVAPGYRRQFGIEPEILLTRPTDGAAVVARRSERAGRGA